LAAWSETPAVPPRSVEGYPVSVYVKAYTLTSALGAGIGALRASLRANRTGLDDREWPGSDVPCFLGRVDLPESIEVAPHRWSQNTRLVEFGLQQDSFADAVAEVREQVEHDRLGLVLGTSTSAIDRTEEAYRRLEDDSEFLPRYRQPEVHNPHAPTAFAAERLGIEGPRITVSAACASLLAASPVSTAARAAPESRIATSTAMGMAVTGGGPRSRPYRIRCSASRSVAFSSSVQTVMRRVSASAGSSK